MSRIDSVSPPTSDPCWSLVRLTALLVDIVQTNHSMSAAEPPAGNDQVKDSVEEDAVMEEGLA
ncbi:MAG: hypothetical protein M3R02_11585 [Chloroflexota bacterium]|nr:hypothetical protein [Chloroflexota bacterium]